MIFWYIFMSGAPNSCWESHIKPNTLHKVARANILSQCYSPAEIWLGSPWAFGDPHRDSVGKRIWIPSVYDILVQIYDWLPYGYILWLKSIKMHLRGGTKKVQKVPCCCTPKGRNCTFFLTVQGARAHLLSLCRDMNGGPFGIHQWVLVHCNKVQIVHSNNYMVF